MIAFGYTTTKRSNLTVLDEGLLVGLVSHIALEVIYVTGYYYLLGMLWRELQFNT
jgi:hypothetical protein